MTDLSTKHLQYLLAESSPRPWIFREDTDDTVFGTQEIGHEVYAGQKCLFGVWNDPVIDEHPDNLPLAALAPDLAQEVLRMRDQLTAMKRPWFAIAIDPERMAVEHDLATYVLEHIDHILGEAND